MNSILKSALHTIGTGIVLVLSQAANGQGPECMTYVGPEVEQQAANCGQFGDAFHARFKHQSAYVPGQALNPGAIKTIRIAVHVWQDENGGNNYPDNEATRTLINGAIAHLGNDMWSNNEPPSDPVPGAPFISDTRIRVDYYGLTFHQNAALNSLVPNVHPQEDWSLQAIAEDETGEMEKCLMLHLVCPCDFVNGAGTVFPGVGGAAAGTGTGGNASTMSYVVSKGRHDASQNNINSLAGHWAHEIGHIMGLDHTYPPDGESCSPTFHNFLWDVFGGVCPHPGYALCNPFDPANDCTNNIMGATNEAGYYSPLQIGRVHQALARRVGRKYAWGYDPVPHVVQVNEHWPFYYKSYQDIIIPAGVTLTLSCTLEMVPEAKVIVEPGGQLIIDGGTITAAQFADSWAGVEVCGYNTHNQYSGWRNGQYIEYLNQGYLELKNGGTIEHARTGIVMEDNGVPGTSGGVVVSNGGIIRNCQRSS